MNIRCREYRFVPTKWFGSVLLQGLIVQAVGQILHLIAWNMEDELSSLTGIIERFPSIHILVIGDIILDHYIFGDVSRISPEAPVPVVEIKDESFRLGGAANTVANIRSLNGQVDVVGVIGRDENGSRLRKMLQGIGANVEGLLCDGGRPTIIKTRVIARHQQVVRIDREVKDPVDDVLKEEITRIAEATLPKVSAVICSDYDKGVLSKDILEVVLAPRLRRDVPHAKEQDIPIVIDPKMQNFWYYKGATLVTPNVKEASAAFGKDITDDASLLDAGKTLLQRLELLALLITRGEHGMSLFEDVRVAEVPRFSPVPSFPSGELLREPDFGTKVTHIPTVARDVFDVTGAGDTVVAVSTLALAAGASLLDAAKIANCAAGIVVGKIGTASVTIEGLKESLLSADRQVSDYEEKDAKSG